jgi:hypothetical protein
MSEVEDNLCFAVNTLLSDKDKVKSITAFNWIKTALQGCLIAG